MLVVEQNVQIVEQNVLVVEQNVQNVLVMEQMCWWWSFLCISNEFCQRAEKKTQPPREKPSRTRKKITRLEKIH